MAIASGKKVPGRIAECFYYKARRRALERRTSWSSTTPFSFQNLGPAPRRSVDPSRLRCGRFSTRAHTIEAVAADHLGISVTSGQVEYLLNKLYNDRGNKGLLVHHKHVEGQASGADGADDGRRSVRWPSATGR